VHLAISVKVRGVKVGYLSHQRAWKLKETVEEEPVGGDTGEQCSEVRCGNEEMPNEAANNPGLEDLDTDQADPSHR
jgi:hypothetical protein